jgi:hypothetical protein
LRERPELTDRVAAVVGVAGAYLGSRLAGRLAPAYRLLLASSPLLACAPGEGDEIDDIDHQRRAQWWIRSGSTLPVRSYAIVAAAAPARVSPVLAWTYWRLRIGAGANDGQLVADDQMPPGTLLLGIVNADHLEIAIPRVQRFPWNLLLAENAIPRAEIVLAAVDAIAANLADGDGPRADFRGRGG